MPKARAVLHLKAMAVSEKLNPVPPSFGPVRSFGRIKARTLKPRQASLFDTLLPEIAPTLGMVEDLLAKNCPIIFEIGFGGGEHLAGQAKTHPEAIFIGAEPFLNGVGSALRHVEEQGLENVRILADDARPFLESLPDQCLDGLFVLFADPWPKARHHKRRLIQNETLDLFARLLKKSARFRFATDWANYADHTLALVSQHQAFEWRAQKPSDWLNAPSDHVTTRYETKGLGDMKPIYFDFFRV